MVTQTPLLPLDWEGRRIWVKAECLQQGGSFKLRGATNRLLLLSEAERARGVVAFSSGNHAQGVARAARALGIAATIVMPRDAPAVKVEGTRAAGAEIVFFDRATESREEIGARLAAEKGATLVPSFDDVDVIEGQGSVGVEIEAQLGGAAAAGDRALRRRRPVGRHRFGAAEVADRRRRARGLGRMARSLAARADRAGRGAGAADPLRRAADQIGLAADLRRAAEAGARGARGERGGGRRGDALRLPQSADRRRARRRGRAGGVDSGKAGDVPDGSVVVVSGGNVDPRLCARYWAAPDGDVSSLSLRQLNPSQAIATARRRSRH